jgi:hypothetical protein
MNENEHPLDAARGIFNGLIIVSPFWALVIWLVFGGK